MPRPFSVKTYLSALVFTVFAAARVAHAGAAERPNILFIFSDDHAAHAISAYGSRINKTPQIDRLAREGMLFRNCFVTNSICGPSRAVILTGKHSHLNGMIDNRTTFDGSQLTFPKVLRKAGYQTAIVGKWHLKSEPTGFDFWKVLYGQGPYYNPPLRTPAGREPHTGYTTHILTDVALEWLEKGRDPSKPFLLMLQHKAPHRNWQPGPKYLTLYDDTTIPEPATLFDDWSGRTSAAKTQSMTIAHHLTEYDLKLVPQRGLTPEQLEIWNKAYGPKNEAFRKANLQGEALVRWKYQRYIKDYLRCVKAVDDDIGRVLDYLERKGLAGNTVVIYSSDQGFYLGDHGWFDKRWMYEESLRMPFIVRWPGVTPAGSEDRHLVQNLDFAPTFCEIAGAPIPREMQGVSLVPLLRGEKPEHWRHSIYYHYYEYPGPHDVPRHYGVRTERYKLIRYYQIDEWELFDLEKDPDELRSVYSDPAYSGVVRELKAELHRLQEYYGDTNPEAPLSAYTQKEIREKARKVRLAEVLSLKSARAGRASRQDLDPSAKPLTVGAWCTPEAPDGVIVAHGGGALGYSLYILGGEPRFAVRNEGALIEVRGPKIPTGKRVHLAGILDAEGRLRLYVNGKQVAEKEGHFIARKPAEGLTVGRDAGSSVGSYSSELPFKGKIEDLRIYWGALGGDALKRWATRID